MRLSILVGRISWRRFLFVFVGGLALAVPAYAGTVTYEVVAMEGEAPPTGPPGSVFVGPLTPGFGVFNAPVTNDSGQLMLEAGFEQGSGGVTSLDDAVVWGPGKNGNTSIILREGDPAPSAPFGANFSRFYQLNFGEGGHISTRALLTSGATGIWAPDAGGGHSLLAIAGMGAPGAPEGAEFFSPSVPTLNSLGQSAFSASMVVGPGGVTDDSNVGMWGPDASGDTTLLLREGDPVPGDDPSGAAINVVNAPGMGRFAASGGMVVEGFIEGSGISTANDELLWGRSGTGAFSLIAREGEEAPGTGGANFGSFLRVSELAGGSSFVFAAVLTDGTVAVGSDENSGLFLGTTSGAVSLLHREGGTAPGAPGTRFGDLALADVDFNESGELAFFHNLQQGFGGVTSADDQVILGPDGSGTLEIKIREGDMLAGGLQVDAAFNVDMSERGDVAFEVFLEFGVGGVDANNNDGLMVAHRDGDLTMVAREGDVLEIRPGDFRTLSHFGYCCRWNAQGRLAFTAAFDDGSSAFLVATLDDAPPLPPSTEPVPPSPGSNGPLTVAQRRCADKAARGLRGVAKAAARVVDDCIKDHNRGEIAAADLRTCAASDPKGRVQRAEDKASAAQAAACAGTDAGGIPKQPDLFAESAVVVADAARALGAEVVSVLYGADPAATAIEEATDRDAARCQQAVAKSLTKCQTSTLKTFTTCKKKAMKPGADPVPLGANRDVDLESCILANPKKCLVREGSGSGDIFANDKIRKTLDKKCVARGVDLLAAFPGCGSADAGEVQGCLERTLGCLTCEAMNRAEDVSVDCDFLDDGADNDSCHTCRGLLATIVASGPGSTNGTAGDDVIVVSDGTTGLVLGMGGNDVICGGPDRDFLFGNEGHDWLSGGGGDDGLVGEEGDDTLIGGPGDDSCNGGIGTDSAEGCETEIDIP